MITAEKIEKLQNGISAALSPATEQFLEEEISDIFQNKLIPLVGETGVTLSSYKDIARSGDIANFPDPLNFLGEVRNTILPVFDSLQTLGDSVSLTTVQELLFDALGPSGIGLVSSLNEIEIQGALDDSFTIGLSLSSESARFDIPLESDFGLPWLSLAVEEGSSVKTEFDFDFKFEFGLNESGEFFFNTPSDRDIELAIRASIPDLALSGDLGLLQVDVVDEDRDNIANNDGVDSDGNGVKPSSLNLGAVIDLGFTNGLEINRVTPTGTADINLELQTRFDERAVLPSLRSDLNIDWDFLGGSFTQVDGNEITSEIPRIAFNEVQLDLETFVSNFAGPVLEQIRNVTAPIAPIIDILTQEIDLEFFSFSLLDIAELSGAIDQSDRDFIESIDYVVNLIDALPETIGTNTLIDLGSFDLGETDIRNATDLSNTTPEVTKAAIDAKEQLPDGSPEQDFIANLTSPDAPGRLETLLSDPESVFNLLLNQEVELFTYELPDFDFDFNWEQSFPVSFILVTLGGAIGAGIDLGFGYDTIGLQSFATSGDPNDIFNGFFITDHPEAELELRAGVEASAGVGVDLGIVSATAAAGGGLLADIEFDLNDPNSDGKVRAEEFLPLLDIDPLCIFDVEGAIEASLFVEGKLNVGFFSRSVRRETRFPLASFHAGCADNENIVLATENFGASGQLQLHIGPNAFLRAPGDSEDSAEVFILERQSGRVGEEMIAVTAFDSTQDYNAGDRIVGSGGDRYDVIQLASEILTPAALEGNDGFDTLVGGSANDTLSGGEDPDRLVGNDGDDSLSGDQGDDFLIAGPGADTVDGGVGDDIVSYENSNSGILLNLQTGARAGDVADDELISIEQYVGTNFSDSLIGDNQDNILDGLAGDDSLSGAGGRDILFGGAGADTLEGGAGIDGASYLSSDGAVSVNLATGVHTQGHAQGDRLTQIENLQGSRLGDTLVGDEGNNAIDGDLGNDRISGEAGEDSLYGYIGSDTINGGSGNDHLFGDSYDVLESRPNSPLDPLFELIEADAPTSFNDQLDGDAGDDFLSGGWGNDVLNGGTGSDRLAGGRNADELNGGTGIDVADYSNSPEGVTVSLKVGVPNSGGDAEGDVLTEIENLIGSSFDDRLGGVDEQNNVFSPGLGQDRITGGRGLSNTVILDYSKNDIGTGLSNRGSSFFRRYTDDTETTVLDSVFTNNVTIFQITGTRQDDSLQLNGFGREDGEGDRIFLGDGNDSVITNSTFSELVNDRVEGGSGNDFIQVGAGNDTVLGGTGDDTILIDANFGALSDALFNVNQPARNGADIVDGGEGVDTLSINLANQSSDIQLDSRVPDLELVFDNGTEVRNFEQFRSIRTGSGNDVLVQLGRINNLFQTGNGDDVIMPGLGTDSALGGDGIDTIILDYSVEDTGTGVTTNWQRSSRLVSEESTELQDFINFNSSMIGGSFERFNIIGTRKADDISSNNNSRAADSDRYHDTLLGKGGDDTLTSFSGDDQLEGGAGNDSLNAGNGEDTLTGADSTVFVPGLAQIDTLIGGAGRDLFVLGAEGKIFYDDQDATSEGLNDFALIDDFNPSEDRLQLSGQLEDYELVESATDTSLFINKANDEPRELIAVLQNSSDLDLNSVAFEFVDNPSVINFSRLAYSTAEDEPAVVSLVRTGDLTQTFDVTISLSDGTATAPDDYSNTPISVTFLAGVTTVDLFVPIIDDTLAEESETLTLQITDVTAGGLIGTQADAELTLIDNDEVGLPPVVGNNQSERLTGSGLAELIQGLGGDDRLIGLGSQDSLEGGDGNDNLRGGTGDDLLVGGFGNDRLIGGQGRDSLQGGPGQDRFVLIKPSQRIDQILDFDARDDRILLRSTGFNLPRGRVLNSQFSFGNTAKDRNDRLIYSKGSGKLFYDADGVGPEQTSLIAIVNPGSDLTARSFRIV